MKDEILEHLIELKLWAENNQTCLRKAVGCKVVLFERGNVLSMGIAHNGPSVVGAVCSNEVGNCGCSHAEPRVIQQLYRFSDTRKFWMLCTYSPCTNCANIIIDSGLIVGVIYEILTDHDKRGAKLLRKVMPVLDLNDLEGYDFAATGPA